MAENLSKWQLLSDRMSRKSNSKETEAVLERRFEDYLYFIFGWQNIGRQEPVQFGHDTSKRLDLVLRDKNNVPVVMIEMKKQELDPAAENADNQLASYMLAKDYRTKFGLLVGDRLSLYYDDDDSRKIRRVLNLSFSNRNSQLGEEFAKYLVAETFDETAFAKFCKDKLNEPEPPLLSEETFAKLSELLGLYKIWLNKNQKEQDYLNQLKEAKLWAKKDLIRSNLVNLSDNEFVNLFQKIPKWFVNIRAGMRYYINNREEILSKRNEFAEAMAHLAKISEDKKFSVLNDFISRDYQVKNLKKAFWSEIIRAKFDDVPLLNEKTLKFFNNIDVFLGDNYGEEIENVAKFYSDLQKRMNGAFTMDELTHLEHFVEVATEGKEFMKRRFISDEDI